MALTISRIRINQKPGHYVVRGTGAWSTSDVTGTITGLPKGNIIGFRGTVIDASGTVATGIAVDATPTNGVIACTGSLAIFRSASGASGASFFFEIEYDSN